MDAIFAIPVFAYMWALPAQYPAMTAGMVVVYFGGLVIMNVIGAYNDALAAVLTYRKTKLYTLQSSSPPVKTEWDAARAGARANGWSRLAQSVVWPATIAMDIVPSLVLYLHRDTRSDNNNNRRDD